MKAPEIYRFPCANCGALSKYGKPLGTQIRREGDPNRMSRRTYRCEHCNAQTEVEKDEKYWRAVDSFPAK